MELAPSRSRPDILPISIVVIGGTRGTAPPPACAAAPLAGGCMRLKTGLPAPRLGLG